MNETGGILILFLGMLTGIQHSFETDHLVAMSTLVRNNRGLARSSLTGIVWGLGHSATLLIVAAAIMIFQLAMPRSFNLPLEIAVGIMLVVLGLLVFKDMVLRKMHIHAHPHDGRKHIHFHSHSSTSDHAHRHKPAIVGMVHGLAGSGAVVLLAVSNAGSSMEGMLYIFSFSLGLILSMAVLSALISLPFVFTETRFAGLGNRIRSFSGILSIMVGVFIIVQSYVRLFLV